jgi:hypothetical protein
MPIGTIRKILVSLGQIFKYAVRHKYVSYNPIVDAERPRKNGRVKEKKIRVLKPEEIKTFLLAIENEKYRTLFKLAIATGARQGELHGEQAFKPGLEMYIPPDEKSKPLSSSTFRGGDFSTRRAPKNYGTPCISTFSWWAVQDLNL